MTPSMNLDGKTALVTGGSRGLGKGMALALAEAGAKVAIACRGVERLNEARAELERAGPGALAIQADVTLKDNIVRMVDETVGQFGRLDIMIPAAGTTVRSPSMEMTEEEWDTVMDLNLKAVFFCCQEAARQMTRQGKGKIILVGSLATCLGLAERASYTASKGGVGQLTKCLAAEWAPLGIGVNAIAPGYYRTEMTAQFYEGNAWLNRIMMRLPMGRTGDPGDLAGATVFLASDSSDYITGQVLYVDGGFTAI